MIAKSNADTAQARVVEHKTYLDCVPVGQPELLRAPRGVLLLLRRVRGDVTALLLDRAHDLTLSRRVQVVATFSKQ